MTAHSLGREWSLPANILALSILAHGLTCNRLRSLMKRSLFAAVRCTATHSKAPL